MMDLIKNLRHMCRICAVNMKKRRSQNSAVSIFETPQLRDKLRKHLSIDISNNDELPKSICSICYKKVEAIHALAALAKKTENFLLDFIKIAQANLKEAQSTSYHAHFPNEFHSLTMLSNDDDELNYSSNSNTVILPIESEITSDLSFTDKSKNQEKKTEEVVLNFTLNDPLTKNIQKKIVVAKQKQSLQNSLKNSNNNKPFSNSNHIKLNEEVEISALKPIADPGEFIREVNNSLEQKRQNLKMVLNNNNTQTQSSPSQKNSMTDTNSNYKVVLPVVPSTSASITQQFINVGSQIQQQPTIFSRQTDPPPAHIQPVETVQLSKDVIAHAHLSSNANNPAFVKESMNLGSVIKDMDLLKLILKALKWPYNQETLWMQIQRLKNTRFRDVMIDPNLLQDADLMQILSSYLSPLLLQQHLSLQNFAQTSVPASNIPPPPPTLSPSAINILPPSVSYKIPAETSVRLVSVPREEQSKPCNVEQQEIVTMELQQRRDDKREYKQKKSKHHQRRYHHSSVIQQNDQYNSSSRNKDSPIIILSDDEESSHFENAITVTKKETSNSCDYVPKVDLSMMQNFDSSTEIIKAINKSLSLYHQSRATIQQRKKQKRKQSLSRIEFQKNFNDQEIVIIDEHGEQPFKLSNEVSVVTKTSTPIVSTSLKKSDSIQKPAKLKFDFLLPPKKKRKLQNYDTKSTEKYPTTSSSKSVISSTEQASITATQKHEMDKQNNGNLTSSNRESSDNESPNVTIEKISSEKQTNKSKNSTISTENNNKQPDISSNESKPQILSVQIIEAITETSTMQNDEQNQSKTDESTESNTNIEQIEEPDDESDDDGLVIDENYEEKSKEEEPKTENPKEVDSMSKEDTNNDDEIEDEKTENNNEEVDQKPEKLNLDNSLPTEPVIKEETESDQEQKIEIEIAKSSNKIKNEEESQAGKVNDKDKKFKNNSNVRNSKSNSEKSISDEKELPRRTTRNKREMPLITATNKKSKETKSSISPKSSSVGTRIKTRHQEVVKKMQTRNSNISQRGREQKPSTKYNNKSTLRKRI